MLVLEGIEKVERNVLPVLNNLLENREMALEDGTFLAAPSAAASDAAVQTVVDVADADGVPSTAKLIQRLRIRADTAFPALSPPNLNVGSFGPPTRLPHT